MVSKLRAVVVAVCLAITGVVLPAASAVADVPGRLLKAEPLPSNLWLPNAGNAYRVLYTSYRVNGISNAVTGVVFTPSGKVPRDGWPLISWAHGTVGIADQCAPSTAGRSQRDIDYLKEWLAAGYAIAATDYEGLGWSFEHPYENGLSEARSVIDIARVAPLVDPAIGRRWMAVGQSQGGQAAMFTGSFVSSYAPEMDYRGSIATGMPSQWRTLAEVGHAYDPSAPVTPESLLVLSGLAVAHPFKVRTADYLTPFGRDILAKAREGDCYDDLAATLAGKTNGDIFDIDAAERETLQSLLDVDAEIPIKPYYSPIFIAQGSADTVVYPPATQITADNLVAAGNDVTLRYYEGADHDTTLAAALPDLLAFAAAHTGR
jgi:hypothetical protein